MHGTFMSLINNFTYVQSIMLSFYSHIKKRYVFFSLFQNLVVHTTVLFPIKYGLQQLSPSTTYDHAINQERNICLFLQFIQDTCLCNKLLNVRVSPLFPTQFYACFGIYQGAYIIYFHKISNHKGYIALFVTIYYIKLLKMIRLHYFNWQRVYLCHVYEGTSRLNFKYYTTFQ